MKINYLSNRYNKEFLTVNADLDHLLANPIASEKQDCPLFNFSRANCHKLTTRAGYDWQYTTALVLDYDNTITYQEFKNNHKELLQYTYYAYASAGNTTDKHKFRIIIPLEVRMLEDELKWFYQVKLKNIFKGNDNCSVQVSRFHNIPCKTSTNDYWYDINKTNKELNLKVHYKFDEEWYRLHQMNLKELENDFENPIYDYSDNNTWSCYESPIKSIGMSIKDWCDTDWQVGQSNGGQRYNGFVACVYKAKKYQDPVSLSAIRDRCYKCGLGKEFSRAISRA
jgi:hypothetical protein